jgi:hypothetical protein
MMTRFESRESGYSIEAILADAEGDSPMGHGAQDFLSCLELGNIPPL